MPLFPLPQTLFLMVQNAIVASHQTTIGSLQGYNRSGCVPSAQTLSGHWHCRLSQKLWPPKLQFHGLPLFKPTSVYAQNSPAMTTPLQVCTPRQCRQWNLETDSMSVLVKLNVHFSSIDNDGVIQNIGLMKFQMLIYDTGYVNKMWLSCEGATT